MLSHSDRPSSAPLEGAPVAGLVRTHWMLATCVACGHERPHGERHWATCPACGAALHSFPLCRDLQARD